jgi:hypothetical protein
MSDLVGQLGESGEYRMGRVFMFRVLKVVVPACVDYVPHWLGPEEQALIMYWHIHDLWGPANLVASMVAELDDILPRFTDV